MKKLIFGLCFALGLAACSMPQSGGIPTSPGAIADRTIYDEVGAIALSKSVEVTADLATLAIKTGFVKGSGLDLARTLLDKLRAALHAAQSAYRAGNATGYREAAEEVHRTIASVRTLTQKGTVN